MNGTTEPFEEDPVRHKLRERGVAAHIIREGGEGLIARWRKFVTQVEKGYPLGLDDYRNDLDVRGLIALVGLDSAVRTEDDRLRKVLTHTDRSVWGSDVADAFWVRGYPGNASGELLEELEAEGLSE